MLAFEAEDSVCLDRDSQVCADGAVFGSVVMQHGLDGLQADGIFGLSPIPHTNAQNYTSELFLEKLYKVGAIDDAIFSLMINSDDHVDSKITIGGYDSQKFGAHGTELVWHPLKAKEGKFNHWRLHLEGIFFGDHELEKSEIESVIVDSGTSLLLMPSKEFNKLIQLIEHKTDMAYTVTNDFGLESFPCFKDTTYA